MKKHKSDTTGKETRHVSPDNNHGLSAEEYRNFLANASHDEDPVTSIIIIPKFLANPSQPKGHRPLSGIIRREAARPALSRHNSALRADESRLHREFAPVDLLDCCHEAAERSRPLAEVRGVGVSVLGVHAEISVAIYRADD